jgi:TrmH family RNA methyltransferase
LAALQDPGNVGTILRIAESFGAAGCLALSGTASLHNSKVTRASAGSIFRLPCVWDLNWDELVSTFKSRDIAIIGTSPHATESITGWDWTRPTAILIGNEGAGLGPAHTKACTATLKIPHEPQNESLNSAIAAAVVLYEAYRHRGSS